MKKISKTLLANWERIPEDKKENLLNQMSEMSEFILDLQRDDLARNPNPVIEEKYRNGEK